MNFNEAVACFSLGLAGIIVFAGYIMSDSKNEFDLLNWVFATVIIAAPVWCVIVGLHEILITW